MKTHPSARRAFLQHAAAGAAMAAVPWAHAQVTPPTRLEWQQFKTTPWYTPYLDTLSRMKANTNSADRNSWRFWVNVHRNFCPHDASYFLGWHRGYLFHLEQQMRSISGVADLTLPYWNYYQYPQMPAEFLDAASGNPLYVTNRVGSNVQAALSLAPFDPAVTNFRRGLRNAFEPKIESAPHNPVHNLIGGRMATLSSPTDPIFFLHHANIDRLWLAWVRAAGGRVMPPRTNSYWSGTFTYATDLTLPRVHAWDTLTNLGYDYDNTTMPTSLPLARNGRSGVVRVQATRALPVLPPRANVPATPPGGIGADAFSLGGARGLGLDQRSVSVQLPVTAAHVAALQAIGREQVATIPESSLQFRSAWVVLDGLNLTPQGAQGGYFYEVYLNLPATPDFSAPKERHLIGTLGAFEVEAGRHHGQHSAKVYEIGERIAGLTPEQLTRVTVSFVRINGENAPSGRVIDVAQLRVELSTQPER